MDPNIPPKLYSDKIEHEASCHCGAIKNTVMHPNLMYQSPHSTTSPAAPVSNINIVVECNCSICQRNGYVLVYPQRGDVHFAVDDTGVSCQSKLKDYKGVGRGLFSHKFCEVCGSSMLLDFNDEIPPRFNMGDPVALNVCPFCFQCEMMSTHGGVSQVGSSLTFTRHRYACLKTST